MTFFRLHITIISVLLGILLCFCACTQEEIVNMPNGELRFSITQFDTDLNTRATPSELGKPVAEKFNLKIQRQNSEYVAYDGTFKESIEVSVGNYNIKATCGENVLIGKDAPYYVGNAQTTVEKDKSTTVKIPCKVGNALVSVRFGRDSEEAIRFDRYYEDYGLVVRNGDYSMSIGKDETSASIYFPAGTSPELLFYGTLKQDEGRTVHTVLKHKDLPSVFQAADHAILTISLPDPVSAIVVNIDKVELEEARLDETIPLSWLPVPTATAKHNYNTAGMLMGTDITFSNTYPEMTWEARVSNEAGDTLRRITGTGTLTSTYSSSEEWPYLYAGKYKATYFLHTEDGVNKVSSREFTIGSPQLEIFIDGYTSYSKYEEGDIAKANSIDGHTLYEPSVSINIAPALISIPKYGFQMSYTFEGSSQQVASNNNLIGDKKLDARLNPYVLTADVKFAEVQLSASKNFRITGIPFHFEPPTTSTWQKDGDVTDEGDYARMGRWNGGSQSLTYSKVALPSGTNLDLDYKFIPNAGAVSTTFSIYAGNQTLVSGKAGSYDNITYEGVTNATLTSDITSIRCHNSYGAGATGTDLYRVALRYRK